MNQTQFYYRNDELYCEKVRIAEVAEEFGTPVFVYSASRLKENILGLLSAADAASGRWRVSYALKANSNPEILKVIASFGLGASVVSGGELLIALRSGFPADSITFDGPGKTEQEIRLALDNNIKAIVVESEQELETIADIAAEREKLARVYIRVNPHVDAKTHPYISTGLLENKFGIALEEAEPLIAGCNYPWVKLVGLHSHIGSQITESEPFAEAASSIADFVRLLQSKYGIVISEVDLGGGIGIPYHGVVRDARLPVDTASGNSDVPEFATYFEKASAPFAGLQVELTTEPGRAIIADTCALVSTVLYTKKNSARTFAIVDAAMNDLLRPSLYGSYHQIVPATIDPTRQHTVTSVVGPICETGDFLALDRELLSLRPKDTIAVLCAGAYGYALSSNYNLRPRAAEVIVFGSESEIIRDRETIEDILQ
ncbi:MAG: diaminopimelate decarboxylase [Bacteroidetes bacterium]|nr:diaminopimelate decarboxylase [Bacteroidota bacterium]